MVSEQLAIPAGKQCINGTDDDREGETYLDEAGCVKFQTFNSLATDSKLRGTSRFLRSISELQQEHTPRQHHNARLKSNRRSRQTDNNSKILALYGSQHLQSSSVVRTSVLGRRTFPDLRPIYG